VPNRGVRYSSGKHGGWESFTEFTLEHSEGFRMTSKGVA
jgi:hypothetical protein